MANNPTLLAMPLAQNGQKNVIPETQATAGDGLFSQSTGFPAETSLPLGAGGVAPDRADFNGAFNLLSGVAFMAQKGFTFNYDATQDYYTGCIVIDPTDGLRYECIADMAAGTIAPSADTTNTYWAIFKSGLDREQIPAFNHRDVITTSGTYTAPVTGWYKITVKGGGGGGSGAAYNGTGLSVAGSGGGEGGTTIGVEYMIAGQNATVVIGAGGTGGNGTAADSVIAGGPGGNSSVSVNSSNLIGYGGTGGSGAGGVGGAGTIPGAPGASIKNYPGVLPIYGGNGGGAGGSQGGNENGTQAGINGGGGGGGMRTSGGANAGSSGGNGFVWFEYFAEV